MCHGLIGCVLVGLFLGYLKPFSQRTVSVMQKITKITATVPIANIVILLLLIFCDVSINTSAIPALCILHRQYSYSLPYLVFTLYHTFWKIAMLVVCFS